MLTQIVAALKEVKAPAGVAAAVDWVVTATKEFGMGQGAGVRAACRR